MVQDDDIQYASINAVREFLMAKSLDLKTQSVCNTKVEWGSSEDDIHSIKANTRFILEHDGWIVQIDKLIEMHFEYAAQTNTRYAQMIVDECSRLVIRDCHPKHGIYMVRISIP